MSNETESVSGIPFAAWKRSPGTWSIYLIGLLLNRDGAREERLGARIMAWALARLVRKAGVK